MASKAARNNRKVVKSFFKWWGKNIWNSSTQPVRYLWKVITDSPKAIDDVIQLVVNLDDVDNILNQAIDIVNDTDLITNGIEVTKEDVIKFQKNTKELFDTIKQVRKENREMEKRKDMKTKNKTAKESTARNSTNRQTIGGKGFNHPWWYLQDKTMVSNLVGINVSNRQNAINDAISMFNVDLDTETPNTPDSLNIYGIPSCASIELELVLPKSNTKDWEQGINMLYKNIRAANAGSINYSPAQLGSYVFTVRGIDACLSTLNRAIKALNSGSFYDALSPQSTFAAMGLDYDSFAQNAANARELYSRLSAIRYRLMPLNITLLDRTRWLFSNVFKDSNDAKAQVYIPFTQRVPYIKSDGELGYATIGANVIDADQTGIKWNIFSNQLLEIFNIYQTDAIFQIISGDILKAYGNESLTAYPEIPMNEVLVPVYDIHILTQIQNASLSVTGSILVDYKPGETLDDFGSMEVTENIVIDPSASLGYGAVALPTQAELINRWIINPTYNTNENVTDAGRLLSSTRLMTSRHATNANTNAGIATITYDTYGTEIAVAIRVIVISSTRSDRGIYDLVPLNISLFAPLGRVGDGYYASSILPVWSWFDYFPLVIPKLVDTVNKKIGYSAPLFDFNNFGIAYKSNLDSYGAIATLSMLHKPFVSRVNKVEVFEA